MPPRGAFRHGELFTIGGERSYRSQRQQRGRFVELYHPNHNRRRSDIFPSLHSIEAWHFAVVETENMSALMGFAMRLHAFALERGWSQSAALRHSNTQGTITYAFVLPRATGEGSLALR